MTFIALLNQLHNSTSVKQHCFGDAATQITYADLMRYFNALDKYFVTHKIKPTDCIAFECANTTAALIVLLALFYRGQHFLLLPSEGNALKEPGFKPSIPEFCKIHLTVGTLNSASTCEPETLVKGVNSYHNLLFNQVAYKRLDLSEPKLLLRTSGSMGDAKMVVFTHAKLLANAKNCVSRFGLDKNSRVTITVPIFHLYGLGAGLIPALIAGAFIDLQADTNILRFMDHQRRFKPNVVYLNPTLCAMLVKMRRKNQQPFKQTISAGAALATTLHQQYQTHFGTLTNLYGSTEMGAAATTTNEQTTLLYPMSGVKITIDENKRLYCSHPHAFNGYINSQGEDITISVSPYSTGDIAKILDKGCFELIAREANSCNRAGFLVQFNDIENALLEIEAVIQVLVLSSNEETLRGQKLYAFCQLDHERPFAENQAEVIRQACFKLLPRYAVPDEIILRQSLPLLANGKIDRQTLKQSITV
jgi:acyl-coenzyme A synthetase/AMP-(fatty) acid ligase